MVICNYIVVKLKEEIVLPVNILPLGEKDHEKREISCRKGTHTTTPNTQPQTTQPTQDRDTLHSLAYKKDESELNHLPPLKNFSKFFWFFLVFRILATLKGSINEPPG